MIHETLPFFPAVRPAEESAIEVDVTDLEDDAPTEPQARPPERITERPSADDLEALVHGTRVDAPWLGEPVFAIDPETCRLVLARPYLAQQRDQYGNLFRLECPVGVELELPPSPAHARALRSTLVSATLGVVATFRVVPHNGTGELRSHLDDEWRLAIVEAFALGDAGALERHV